MHGYGFKSGKSLRNMHGSIMHTVRVHVPACIFQFSDCFLLQCKFYTFALKYYSVMFYTDFVGSS